MRLNDLERTMLAGEMGPVRQLALQHQIKVGDFFGAERFVPVAQAHIMADTESLGEAGIAWLEMLASHSLRSLDGAIDPELTAGGPLAAVVNDGTGRRYPKHRRRECWRASGERLVSGGTLRPRSPGEASARHRRFAITARYSGR